ncbi:MAG: DUF1573 domain-containing protein [Nitrospinae bacterium]|nr:DUF1573 domain-containing protein [Nitrospinota bacterium]
MLLIAGLSACLHTTVPSPAGPKGILSFTNSFHDFGQVTEGDIIKHTFEFTNAGKGSLRMVRTESDCGCTTTEAAFREYAPGERGALEVTIDTRGKHGITVKSVKVFLENAEENIVELTLTARLVPPPHPKVENRAHATTDVKCRTCHLESGVGMQGAFLYHRVCAQCHGRKGAGAGARALNDVQWLGGVDDAFLREVTAKGQPEKGMPPFVEGVTPPLTGEQMDSLIEYIRSWGKQ